jgi:hypothetical protein
MSTPGDFRLTYHWAAPTVRPPLHYEFTITLGSNQGGKIEFLPDYPNHNPPRWEESFSVKPAALDALASLMEARHVFDGTFRQHSEHFVGGQQNWLEVSFNGKQIQVPAELNASSATKIQPVYDAIRALVPQPIWDRLEAQRQEYISSKEG